MKRHLSLFVVAVLAGCGTTPPPDTTPEDPAPPTVPETTACADLPETLPSLEVPTGTLCLLSGTAVQGDVMVAAGATAEFYGVQVGGNIVGEGAAEIMLISGTSVAGDVLLSGGGDIDATGLDAAGDVRLLENSGVLGVSEASIEGDLEVSRNTGGVVIDSNTVGGSLSCEGNEPAPEGSENQVAGEKIGQCTAL